MSLELYVGNPLKPAGMILMPRPPRGYSRLYDRNITEQTPLGGGSATARKLHTKQTFVFQWPFKSREILDTVLGFYTDSWGGGPYIVLDPANRNYLHQDTSLMGPRRGVLSGWAATVGTPSYDSTLAPFQRPSGVAKWVGAGSGSVLGAGTVVSSVVEADTASAMPYVATEQYTWTVYARTLSGTASVTPQLSGRNAAQTLHTNVGASAVTLTTTYQRLSITSSVGAFTGAQYVIPTLLCNTASAPTIHLSNPMIQLASAADLWVVGQGAPRCNVIGQAPSSIETVYTQQHIALSLQAI